MRPIVAVTAKTGVCATTNATIIITNTEIRLSITRQVSFTLSLSLEPFELF